MTYGLARCDKSKINPMATEWTQETVLRFLADRGGRVRNADLIEHFRSAIPSDPPSKTAAKEAFKRCVDSIAFVKVENGEKYVCLKKKFRVSLKRSDERGCNGHVRDSGSIVETTRCTVNSGPDDGVIPVKHSEKDNEENIVLTQCCAKTTETNEDEDAKQEILPGSGCGTDSIGDAQPPPTISESVVVGTTADSLSEESQTSKSDMGNTNNSATENESDRKTDETLQACQQRVSDMSIPEIAVTTDCPVLVATDKVVCSLPQPTCLLTNAQGSLMSDLKLLEEETAARKGSQGFRRRSSRGSQRHSTQPESGADEGHFDISVISSGSDSNTPKGSRKNFIEHMMNSSPQVRRSMVLRNSVHLSARYKDSSKMCDGDSTSVNSCSADDENTVTLDPLEHEWMMCASDGEWESLHRLLTSDPNLITKKDFVTGFTCFHWAAKLGKQELLAVLVNFAKQHGVMVNINARSSAGYTPLHLAAMHNHIEVVKLLVGAYDADVEARDYSGKKAGQYLRNDVAQDIFDIVGAGASYDAVDAGVVDTGRWRLSKVIQSNLRPLKLLNHSLSEDDVCDGAGLVKEKPLRRKSSLNKFKPRLSKIVHSTSLFERLEREAGEASGSVKSRPKSNLFG